MTTNPITNKTIAQIKEERYHKKELIGTGAFKTVYKAYDDQEGIEVAWNQVKLSGISEQAKKKIFNEISILKQLSHPNIIQIYDAWETDDKEYLIFITEIMYSGTIRDFIRTNKKIRLRTIKKWCKHILSGLEYLHLREPPIIHRDIKCDNIFLNGNKINGEIKIGDMGLSVCMNDAKFAVSITGTPEFMAPELFDENYNEKVDVYSFGMCVLEMVTGQYPYSEIKGNNVAAVYKRIMNGIKPEAINKIQNKSIREFIYLCLKTKDERPSSTELLQHPFLQPSPDDDEMFYYHGEDSEALQTEKESRSDSIDKVIVIGDASKKELEMKLYHKIGDDDYKEIKFPFVIDEDTPESVALEMAREFSLDEQDCESIANAIREALSEINVLCKKTEISFEEKLSKSEPTSLTSQTSQRSTRSTLSEEKILDMDNSKTLQPPIQPTPLKREEVNLFEDKKPLMDFTTTTQTSQMHAQSTIRSPTMSSMNQPIVPSSGQKATTPSPILQPTIQKSFQQSPQLQKPIQLISQFHAKAQPMIQQTSPPRGMTPNQISKTQPIPIQKKPPIQPIRSPQQSLSPTQRNTDKEFVAKQWVLLLERQKKEDQQLKEYHRHQQEEFVKNNLEFIRKYGNIDATMKSVIKNLHASIFPEQKFDQKDKQPVQTTQQCTQNRAKELKRQSSDEIITDLIVKNLQDLVKHPTTTMDSKQRRELSKSMSTLPRNSESFITRRSTSSPNYAEK